VALIFRGDEFNRFIGRKLDAFLRSATVELHRISLKKASITNQGKRLRIKRPRKGGNKTSRTIYPNSSIPGESPRRRTGFGRKNIVWGYRSTMKVGRVGYTRDARYMTFHELGIRYRKVGYQQRPTIIPALRDSRAQIVAIARAEAAGTR
jgi:hypothetical protein